MHYLMLLLLFLPFLMHGQRYQSGVLEYENVYNKAAFTPETDSTENKMSGVLQQMMQNMVNIMNNKRDPNITCYFDAFGCRTLITGRSPDSSYIYQDHRTMQQVQRDFRKNGVLVTDTLLKHEAAWQGEFDWDYVITKYPAQKKKILGFDCYRIEILELKLERFETDTTRYVAYVTDDLALPMHTLLDWRNWLDLGTPLEITTSKRSDQLQVESMLRAIRFKKKLPKGIMEVPPAVRPEGKQITEALIDALNKKK